jgi:hypothetical protein
MHALFVLKKLIWLLFLNSLDLLLNKTKFCTSTARPFGKIKGIADIDLARLGLGV